LTGSCRLCFKTFYMGAQNIALPSRHDNSVCVTCWETASDTKARASEQADMQSDAQQLYVTTLPQQTPPTTSGPEWTRHACVDCQKDFVSYPNSTKCFECLIREQDEIEVTPQGGKHSRIGMAFHHLDPELMLELARVLYEGGAKYGRENRKSISTEDHLNHALSHIFMFMNTQGSPVEDLEHAIVRLMFAWTTNKEGFYRAAN
jgi:hypothetical protein